MNEQLKPTERIEANINAGEISGQVAVGSHIQMTQTVAADPIEVTAEELAELQQVLTNLKSLVAANAVSEKKAAALERVDELAEAVTAEEPDLSTMEYVKNWFGKHLPTLAGAVTSVVIHPIVGKLVEAAGELVSAEFRRRFE